MEYILTGKDMKALDRYTIENIGIPSLVLMENAARSAVHYITDKKLFRKILIVCGTGNNGADGLCIYRILKIQGFSCDCIVVGDEQKATEEFCIQKKILENLSFELSKECDFERYDMIVDALFGVGLSRAVTGIFAETINKMNTANAYIYAVDIPSGISSDTGNVCGCAVKADRTVTFGYRKTGIVRYPGKNYCGHVLVCDIGYSNQVCKALGFERKYCTDKDLENIPKRDSNGNKGTFGKILIIAGSEKYSGAAILSCKAAYRTGAGMVKLVTHKENKTVFGRAVPEALSLFYENESAEEFQKELENSIQWADVIAVGPGLSQSKKAKELLEFILNYYNGKRVILDADALNLLSQNGSLKEKLSQTMILTPHLMEMARLTGRDLSEVKKYPEETARDFANRYHCNIVLKDAVTISTDGKEFFYNLSGNSGMATAGSGDVLTGILAAAAVWKLPVEQVMALGVYIHGKTGDLTAQKYGEYGMTANDMINKLSFIGTKRMV